MQQADEAVVHAPIIVLDVLDGGRGHRARRGAHELAFAGSEVIDFVEVFCAPEGIVEQPLSVATKEPLNVGDFQAVSADVAMAGELLAPRAATVIEVDSYEEAAAVVNMTRYGLSSSIFTNDTNTAFRAMRDFETGIIYVNAGTIGAETHLPFGGTKGTGNGHREAGHAALDTFTEWKAVYVDY